jgi:hypothetical protein
VQAETGRILRRAGFPGPPAPAATRPPIVTVGAEGEAPDAEAAQ